MAAISTNSSESDEYTPLLRKQKEGVSKGAIVVRAVDEEYGVSEPVGVPCVESARNVGGVVSILLLGRRSPGPPFEGLFSQLKKTIVCQELAQFEYSKSRRFIFQFTNSSQESSSQTQMVLSSWLLAEPSAASSTISRT
jgi:hypothetical protein